MAKFRFRMATLLKLRETARDERRSALTAAHQAADILRQQEEQLEAETQRLRLESRNAAGPGTVDIDRLLGARRYEMILMAQQEDLGRKRKMIDEEIERRRLALVEANREVRVLELLREKQIVRHRDEESLKDVKLLDEVAQRVAGREDVA